MAGHLQRAESEVSGLVKIFNMASAFMSRGEPVEWNVIRRSILRTRPPYAASLNALIAFAAARSGGPGATFMTYLHKIHGLFVPASKRTSLPMSLYSALADFPHHHLALAFWQAAYTCPEDKVRGGMCLWISGAEVSALVSKSKSAADLEKIAEADRALVHLRQEVVSAGLPSILSHNGLLRVFGKTDVAMARYVLHRQAASKEKHYAVQEVVAFFQSELRNIYPDVSITPFASALPQGARSSAAKLDEKALVPLQEKASVPLHLHRLTADGELIDGHALLRRAGLDLGAVVREPGGSSIYRIAGVEAAQGDVEAKVLLEGLGDNKNSRSTWPVDAFLKAWVPASERDVHEKHPAWPASSVHASAEFQALRVKASVLSSLGALSELVRHRCCVEERISIYVKPTRKVVAEAHLPAGSLVLLPETLSMKLAPREHPLTLGYSADGALEVKMTKTVAGTARDDPLSSQAAFLTPATADKALAAFWFVGTTPEASAANLSWAWYGVQDLAGVEFEEGFPPQLPPPKRVRTTGKTAPDLHDGVIEQVISFPVLVNSQPIEKGTELLCFRPAQAKVRKAAAPITVTALVGKP